MLPAHDVSRVHPLSCLSLSQREAIPSPRQVQRLLGKSDGRGNLPRLHPIRPVTVIRRVRLWCCSTSPSQIPAFFPASAPWCAPFLDSCLSSARNAHRESPLPPAMLASPSFHDVFEMFPHLVAESLRCDYFATILRLFCCRGKIEMSY